MTEFKYRNKTKLNHQKGLMSELLASQYLLSKGYKIITKQYKKRGGEIDIIAMDKSTLVFIECKYRSDLDAFYEVLSKAQMGRILKTSQYFLQENIEFQKNDFRFDLIIMLGNDIIEHSENLFLDDGQ